VGDVFGWYDLPELKESCALSPEKLFQALTDKFLFKNLVFGTSLASSITCPMWPSRSRKVPRFGFLGRQE
jgi:hypothetical protein